MKAKILILLGFLALASCSSATNYNKDRQQRQNSVKNVNKRNKKALKKWGLAQINWEEVNHGK